MTNVTLSNKLKHVTESAFKDCTSLKNITIPSSVGYISSNAFENCSSLESISLTNSTTSLYDSAFKNCIKLETVTLPNTMHFIDDNVFYGCTSLKNIIIPNRINVIGEYTFYGCSNLTDVVLPNEVSYIQTYAFAGCTNLSNIIIPSTVKEIGGWAFYGCDSLSSIFIPEKAVLGIKVFCDWKENQTINIEADSAKENWDSEWNANCNAKINFGVKRISGLSVSDLTIEEKISQTLQVNITPENAYNKKLEYVVADENIATIDENGIITPLSNGTTKITIKTTDGSNLSTYCYVTVKFKVTNIILDKTELLFNDLTTTYTLKPTAEPEYAQNKTVYWYTTNEKIARVTNEGNVIPVSNGTCQIYCRNISGTTAYCDVTVDIKATNLEINRESFAFSHKHTCKLTASVGPDNVNNKNVKWESSDTNVATVSETGLVTPINNGTCEIICTTEDGSNLVDKCIVTVAFKVTSLSLEQYFLNFDNNTAKQLIAYVGPFNANNKKLLWESTNSEIATVDANGIVKPLRNGECEIICKTTDGSNISTYCRVKIYFKPTEIKLDQTKLEFETDDMQKLTATAFPDYVPINDLLWESTDTSVATVEFGRIKPISYGTCEIICYLPKYPNIQGRCTVEVKYKVKPLYINVSKFYNPVTNKVEAIAHSTEVLSKIPSSWQLCSVDGTYRKTYSENGIYSATFVDIYGNERKVTFTIDEIDKQAPNLTINKIYDSNTNTVKVEALSDEILGKTKPTWKLSEDKMTYSKVYNANGIYSTKFVDIYGNGKEVTFIIDEIDDVGPQITIKTTYDINTNTVKVEATSNEILGETKPTWKLSQDKMTYSKIYNKNGTYSTKFADIYGNITIIEFDIDEIQSIYKLEKEYDKNTNTVKVKLINNFRFQQTKPTWILSEDQRIYSKTYNANGTYTTTFVDLAGNSELITFTIAEIDDIGPQITIKTTYDNNTNTVKVEAISNETLGETKPTWKLSEDKMTYSKIYNANGEYSTKFVDIFGNITIIDFSIDEIQFIYRIEKEYDEKTNTVKVSLINEFGLQQTKPTWTLNNDKTRYSKTYNTNGTYSTTFVDLAGNSKVVTFTIDEIDVIGPQIKINIIYDNDTNTVKVEALSNELLGKTKPTWKLSEDKMTYSKVYNANGIYSTKFVDIYGNETIITFTIDEL